MKTWILALAILCVSTLQAETKVLMISGSTREDSYNKKLIAQAAAQVCEVDVSVTLIDLRDYPTPLYDGDLEASSGMPPNAKRLRDQMIESDVIVIASPEYNGSLSAVLKNAIDWASRSEDGQSSYAAFKEKTFVIMSASPGSLGGKRGLAHLREIIGNVGGIVISREVTVSHAHTVFNDREKLEALKLELSQLMKEAISS